MKLIYYEGKKEKIFNTKKATALLSLAGTSKEGGKYSLQSLLFYALLSFT